MTSTREKKIKEESIHKKSYTAKNGTRPEETTNTAMNRIGSLTTNVQLQNQHLIKCEKNNRRKLANSNNRKTTKSNKNMETEGTDEKYT